MLDTGAPVYVVDDDASVREAVEGLVRSAGLRAKSFVSAQDYLASAAGEIPSCLVLDVELPGLSGLDLQQELARADLPIPIIFLTGHGDIPMSVRAMKAGALEFLTKPIDDEVLLNAIRKGIAHGQLQRAQRRETWRSSTEINSRHVANANAQPPLVTREIRWAGETRSAQPALTSAGHAEPQVSTVHEGVFRKEVDYWTVGVSGRTVRLKESKGLECVAHLLRHPGVEFHVLDLAGGIGGARDNDEVGQIEPVLPRGDEDLDNAGIHIGRLGDAGEMLDEQAKAAYRRRLSELSEELDKAKERGNVECAERAELEIDALTAELSRAVGLGGRNRRAASASERARQSITKRIRKVLERIAQNDEALGNILSRCIRTGNFCRYQPDPEFPITWKFEAANIEPDHQLSSSGDPAPPTVDRLLASPTVLAVSPFALAKRTAFVGRQSEVKVICGVMERALSSQGSLVMLEGGPGVGKTRLAMEMAEYASGAGFRCLVGHCYERDERLPYLPFVEIIENDLAQAASPDDYHRCMGNTVAELAQIAPSLRRIFPNLPNPIELPAAQQRRYLFQGVSETLARAARTRPQLLVLEDLHWADESTLDLLTYLACRIAQLPVVIIGTYRGGYSDENSALVRTLEELIRTGVCPQKLSGLSREAVAQMLHELSRRHPPESLINPIFEVSQGNPFFVEEVYRHLVEDGKLFDAAGEFRTDLKIEKIDVPENVRLIIRRRLERFDKNEKRALEAAAVIGRSFSFRLLTAVSQIAVDELFTVIEKAQRVGIIVPSSEGPERPFTFRHELVRQTLLAGISVPRQEQLHASVAEAIERLYPDAVKEDAGEIADHLLKAGSFADRQMLIRWLTLSGKRALGAAGFEEARRNFHSALSHQAALEPRQKADLLASIAIAERGLGRWDAAVVALHEALEVNIDLGDRKMIAKSYTRLTDALIWVGRFEEATETARRGLNHQSYASADRARLLTALGQALAYSKGYEEAHEALLAALRIASELSDPKLEAMVLAALSAVNYHFFRFQEVAADGLLIEQFATSTWQRAQQLHLLHQSLLYLGKLEEALRIARLHEPLARKIGHSYAAALCLAMRAWAEFCKAPALAKLEICLQQLAESGQSASFGFSEVFYKVQLSLVDFLRGNWTSALAQAQTSCRHEARSFSRGLGIGTLFRQKAYAGDRAGALAILDEERPLLPHSDQNNTRGSWWYLALVIEGLVMLGEQSHAGELYPLALELIGTGAIVLWPNFRFTQTIAAIAAAAAHQWEAAEGHFQVALQQAKAFPNLLEQAEICRFHAMMLLDRSAPEYRSKAQRLLREAVERYTQIGMPRHIETARALIS